MILARGDFIASFASRPRRAHSSRNKRSAKAPKYFAQRRRSSCVIASVSGQFLFRFAPRRSALRIIHLEPVWRSSRHIARALALRHDAFKAERPCVPEHGRAIAVAAVDPFVAQYPGLGVSKQSMEFDFALLKCLTSQILAVEFD